MAVDTKKTQAPTTAKQAASAPASAPTTAPAETSDPWADYSSLAEATKTRSGFPLLRSLAGETVFVTTVEQDEKTKTYLATLVNINTDKSTPDYGKIIGERGKYAVAPTYAAKLVAALKARPATAPGIRVRLGEQKRGIGLS